MHFPTSILLFISLALFNPGRITAVHGVTFEEARAALNENQRTPGDLAQRCKRLFQSARTGCVQVHQENRPVPVEMSLWAVVEMDSRWSILGDLWKRFGQADAP